MVTAEQFRKLFPNNKEPEAWTAALNAVLPKYGIISELRIAAFLSQCGHESHGFTDLTENLNYSADALAATWPNRYAVDPKAKEKVPNALAKRLHRIPQAIANNVYANRMGNGPEESGDGWRYRGYGPLQITGKANRLAFAKFVGKSLEESEAYIRTKPGAVELACWYWSTRNLNRHADAGDTLALTKVINGGTNGFEDRKARYAQAITIFSA